MRSDLPDVLGVDVMAGLHRAADDAVARPGAAMDAAWPAIERAMFRLAGLAVSHWSAAGRTDAEALPVRRPDGTPMTVLAMGSAVELLTFCNDRAELLPTSKLTLPAVKRLRGTVADVAHQIRDVDPQRLRTSRFDLAAVVESARSGDRKGVTLSGALAEFVKLRNLEAHHAGRAQEWVDAHPDYPRLFAPLMVDAAWDLLTNADLAAPLHGWCVATVTDISPARHNRATLTTFDPDAPTVMRAYTEGPGAGLDVGDQAVLNIGADPTRARVVMPFIDVSRGVPDAL